MLGIPGALHCPGEEDADRDRYLWQAHSLAACINRLLEAICYVLVQFAAQLCDVTPPGVQASSGVNVGEVH